MAAARQRSRGSRLPVWLGIALSLVAGSVLLWRVDFADLRSSVATADLAWFAPALVAFALVFVFRAMRWAVLLGGTRFVPTWHANLIGYMFNITLPLRLGEIARAYVITKRTDVSMARALSAVMVERMIDLGSVLLLFAWFARDVPMRASFTHAATVGSLVVVLAVFFAGLVVVKGATFERIATPLLERGGKARAERWIARFRDVQAGFRSIGSPRRMASCFVLTVLTWSASIGVAALSLRAFLPVDTFRRGGLVVVMSNLGGALPSAPGGLGIVQGFATSALVVPFQVPEGRALAFVLVWSLSQQLLLLSLGFVSLGRVGLGFREIRDRARISSTASDRPGHAEG